MARSTATPSRSDAIRDYLKRHSDAGIKAIQEALKEQGVEVSAALVSKIKYRSNTATKKRGRKASSKPSAVANSAAKFEAMNGEKVNKSAEIRGTFRSLGKQARPKDVVAALAEKGITVSSAQVSMVRFNMKAKKAARKAAAPAVVAPTSKPIATRSKSTSAISGQDLIEAKRLADELGGVERLKAALDVLAQLA